jgi:L-ascorbate metabolism protein UlaG (beta-lactamase superfamily)
MAHRFHNQDLNHRPHGPGAVLRWGLIDRLTGRRRKRPAGPPAPVVSPDRDLIHSDSGKARLTWLGHASFLGTVKGCGFLIDPVFSTRAGWLYRRHLPPALTLAELPHIEVVLITHNHYDHLDAEACSAFVDDPVFVVPQGLGEWVRRRGRRRIIELEWWETARIGGLAVTLVPARHWSRRGLFDTNKTLWGGYVVESDGLSLYHAGDSAAFEGFAEIGRRFPGLDVAMLPIGGYEPAWFMEHHHLNPEQAGTAFVELGARRLVPMHWGSFQLTDEPLCEPLERLRSWWARQDLRDPRRLHSLAVGETLVLGSSHD